MQHGQQDAPSTPFSKRRKNAKKKRAVSSRSLSPTTAAPTDPASGSTSFVGPPSSGTPATGTHRYGCGGGYPEGGAQDENHRDSSEASEELAIDVVPTSSSKRCHSASVMLRGTVDMEVNVKLSCGLDCSVAPNIFGCPFHTHAFMMRHRDRASTTRMYVCSRWQSSHRCLLPMHSRRFS